MRLQALVTVACLLPPIAAAAGARDAAAVQFKADRRVLWTHGPGSAAPAAVAAIQNAGFSVQSEFSHIGVSLIAIPESEFADQSVSAAAVNANAISTLQAVTGQDQFEPDSVVGAYYNLEKVGAAPLGAWSVTRGSADISVLVIDTGVDPSSPWTWVNPGEIAGDGFDNDGNGYIDDVHGFDAILGTGDPTDQNGHGSHVAGTIASDLYGVAPGARVAGCRFLDASGSGSISDALACINYGLATGFNVTNNSWGAPIACSNAMSRAVEATVPANQLFVAAAGNENRNLDLFPSTPATCAGAFTVGSTDAGDARSAFSNFGSRVDIWAPGSNIVSTGLSGAVVTMSGTSMAAPHVSGAAALLLSLAGTEGLGIDSLKVQILKDADLTAGGLRRLNAARLVGADAPASSSAMGRAGGLAAACVAIAAGALA